MIRVHIFTFNPFAENTLILYDNSGECVIIDAGCYELPENNEIRNFITNHKLNPVRLLNTHCHIDHVLGNRFISKEYGLISEIHKNDLPVLNSTVSVALMWNIPHVDEPPPPGKYFSNGDIINFGTSELEVRFSPGHSPGHVVFVSHEGKFVIAGDVLFNMSIGRTDLPGGDYDTLIRSIKEKIFPLSDDFTVYPGHGPATTIGFEKKHNPFLQ
ncbi:MAG: MBL fold metallo-hydrolase [Bacteroidetes bacterium]|nr:MBL fold metallo-hydrolase [Bacteroidota bacterium]